MKSLESVPSAVIAIATLVLTLALPYAARADGAKGTATYKRSNGATVVVTFTHAAVVKGPQAGTGTVMRRLVLSTTDVSEAIKSCQTMVCSDGGIEEGMTIDFDLGSRLNYWFVADGQRVQISGMADPASAKLTTDSPARLAGTVAFDLKASGGVALNVEFDAAVLKELKK